MDTLGISEEERSEIFAILAAILLLTPEPNRRFMGEKHSKAELEARAAANLGIPPASIGGLFATYAEVKSALENRRNDTPEEIGGLFCVVVVVCCGEVKCCVHYYWLT